MKRLVFVALAVLAAWLVALVAGAFLRASTIDVLALARSTPARTALMLAREAEARRAGRPYHVDQRTVPYSAISPLLRGAVLIAEDDAFFAHGGLDWGEIRASAQRNLERGRVVRGGSTITQQLAKNLYLGSEQTLGRKLEELALALRMERSLSKRRILELYLNLIEWGDGVFGAEAAARRTFGVSAAALDAREACLLAAVVINPRRYSPLDPAPRIERRVRIIASRMRQRGLLSEPQYLYATGRAPAPEGFFGRLFGGWFARRPDTTAAGEPLGAATDTAALDSLMFEPDSLAPADE